MCTASSSAVAFECQIEYSHDKIHTGTNKEISNTAYLFMSP